MHFIEGLYRSVCVFFLLIKIIILHRIRIESARVRIVIYSIYIYGSALIEKQEIYQHRKCIS